MNKNKNNKLAVFLEIGLKAEIVLVVLYGIIWFFASLSISNIVLDIFTIFWVVLSIISAKVIKDKSDKRVYAIAKTFLIILPLIIVASIIRYGLRNYQF